MMERLHWMLLIVEKIDLILMDIMMPEINGYQVTQLVKQNPQTKDIPIILVTALQSEHDKKAWFRCWG